MIKAVLCKQYGPPEKLVLETIAAPQPAAGQIVIAVKAAGVNFPDTLIIEGRYQYRPDPPFSPGCEVAGTVTAIGEGVQNFNIGDPVIGFPGWGGFAEQVIVNQNRVVKLPNKADIDWVIAGGFMLAYGTAYHALIDRGRIQPSETVLVLGAAGGVGLAAIEVAKAMGARVIAAASSADKLALCREHGADALINYSTEDLKTRAKDLSDGQGVDLVFDPVGGDLAEPALRAVGWRGRYLVIGFASGEIPRLPLNLVLLKGCELVGVFWGSFTEREPLHNQQAMNKLLNWFTVGTLRPHVDAVYPLDKASEALNALLQRKARGKLVISTSTQ